MTRTAASCGSRTRAARRCANRSCASRSTASSTSIESAALQAAVERALGDLQKAVADFPRMLETISRMIDAARGATAALRRRRDRRDRGLPRVAAGEPLRPPRRTRLLDLRRGRHALLHGGPRGSGLGVLQDESTTGYAEPTPVADLPAIVLDAPDRGRAARDHQDPVPLDRAPACAHGRHRDQEDATPTVRSWA